MRFRTTLAGLTVVLASAALVLAAGAAANGGNSANAKLCQKGGWATLVDADGGSFADQGACVSYAAQGGTFGTAASWSLVVSGCAPLAGFTCVSVSGSGLQPGSQVRLVENGVPRLSRTVGPGGEVSIVSAYTTCAPGSYTWQATGVAADGTAVTSDPLVVPCA